MNQPEVDRILRSLRRNAVIWGVVIGLLVASLAIQVVRLIDSPGIVTVVCTVHDQTVGACAGDER